MPSEVREALNAAGAAPFVQKLIDPTLNEYQRRFTPWVRSIPTKQINSTIYYFNTRQTVVRGGAVPDGGAQPVSTSTYQQTGTTLTHIQAVGSVTGYAQKVTSDLVADLRSQEIDGAIRGYYWDAECFMGWGNLAATAPAGAQPQFDGLDTLTNSFSGGGFQNVIDSAGRALSLSTLDQLIAMVASNAAMPVQDSSWMFVMSTTAEARLGQLLVSQQRYNEVEIEAGVIVGTYKRIPLMPSSMLSSLGYACGTVTGAAAGSAGTGGLANGATYRYMLSPIIARQGEILPSPEVSVTTTAANQSITLSFTPPNGQDGLPPQLWKVWRTLANGASGTEFLLGYVDACVGLQSDGVTQIVANQIIDTGGALIPCQSSGSLVPANVLTSYVGQNTAMQPPGAGQENIYLMSRDPSNIIRPYVREAEPIDVYPTVGSPDQLPFALMGDMALAVRMPKFVGRAYRVAVAA